MQEQQVWGSLQQALVGRCARRLHSILRQEDMRPSKNLLCKIGSRLFLDCTRPSED
jgi:hypothetical protein